MGDRRDILNIGFSFEFIIWKKRRAGLGNDRRPRGKIHPGIDRKYRDKSGRREPLRSGAEAGNASD